MADPTDYYTSRYSGEEIDNLLDIVKNGGGGGGDFADRKLSNLDTPQEALANLGAGGGAEGCGEGTKGCEAYRNTFRASRPALLPRQRN